MYAAPMQSVTKPMLAMKKPSGCITTRPLRVLYRG